MASVMVIPVFIPHWGCPHQCIFCNQNVITAGEASGAGKGLPDPKDLNRIISEYLSYKGTRTKVELAFFGGNFLGLPKEDILRLLSSVSPWLAKGEIHSIRCSTRPDTITPEILAQVRPFGVNLVELGVQSLNDGVLAKAIRGHSRADSIKAVETLKSAGMGVGVQLMTGLPADTPEKSLKTAAEVADLAPDLVRIYPLLVLEESPLAAAYRKGRYRPQTLNDAVALVKEMVKILEGKGIPVVRLGLQAGEALEDDRHRLAGPWHPAFGHLVRSALMLDQVLIGLESCPEALAAGCTVTLGVHPRSESRLRGDKNSNLIALREKFSGIAFEIRTDPALALDKVDIRTLA